MSFLGAISKALTAVFIASNAVINSYAAEESKLQLTDEQFKKLQSKLAYIDYAITANNAIALEKDRSKWYTNIKYRKSIINEIGHAIEKCLLGQNKKENGIVVFWDKMSPKDFTQANYNAWLLYNYVDTVITTKKDVTLDEVASKLEKYNDVDKDRLEKAKHDINKYLEVAFYCKTLRDVIESYNGHNKITYKELKSMDNINKHFLWNEHFNGFRYYSIDLYIGKNSDRINIDLVLDQKTKELHYELITRNGVVKGTHLYYADEIFDNCSDDVIKFLKKIRSILYDNLEIDHGYVTDGLEYNKLIASYPEGTRIKYIGKYHTLHNLYKHEPEVKIIKYNPQNPAYTKAYPYCQD